MEALCRDQGRNYDDYSKKLEKLRRSQPMPTQSGAITRAGGAAGGAGNNGSARTTNLPQRSERPSRVPANNADVSKNLAKVAGMNDK